jgi:hypothetical protein
MDPSGIGQMVIRGLVLCDGMSDNSAGCSFLAETGSIMGSWLRSHRSLRRFGFATLSAVLALSGVLPGLSGGAGSAGAGWLPGAVRVAEAATVADAVSQDTIVAGKMKKRRGDGTGSGRSPQPEQAPAPARTAPVPPTRLPPPPTPPVVSQPLPPPTASACTPRPPVRLLAEPALLPEPATGLPGRDALLVTVTTSGAGTGIRKVGLYGLANVVVEVADSGPRSEPFVMSFGPGRQPSVLRLTLWRPDQALASWLRLTVVDGCGEWSTFAGRGPGA